MLQLKNIKKVYNGVPILNGISLDIRKGEIVSILGPSGSGKTTLLNVILGLAELDGGQILGEVALPIAGIMSDDSLVMVNSALEAAKDEAFRLGVSRGIDPFMTLSFMALPVIPSLRLTTRGVFDVLTQRYV